MVAFAWLPVRSATLRTVSKGSVGHGSAAGLSSKGGAEVVVPRGLGLLYPGLCGFRCVWAAGGPLSSVECCVEGFQRGAFAACEGGGLEESLPASWGVFQGCFRDVGVGRDEDLVCPVEDPPLGVRFEDVDGGLLGGRVQGVPRCDG